MMDQDIANTLYEMDNLEVLRGINSNTIDLIATDPPFNTKRNRSDSAGFYVDNWRWGDTGILPDQWKWNEVHPKWLEEIKDENHALYQVIEATKVCHGDHTAAFLCFLSVRLLEMHRVLKPTGSIYLHCDHTANAYIRMAMDAIFGKSNFRNEIVWCYTRPSNTKRSFPRKHDTIFFYAKSQDTKFNRDDVRIPYNEETLARRGRVEGDNSYIAPSVETEGRRNNEQIDTLFGDGKVPEDWWTDIAALTNQREITGSPDQKPIRLYERIIKASSNEGDLVLDPFCGCATTIIAAKNLKRDWIGVDRRPDARFHIITRLMGISRKERQRLEKYATDREWLNRQMKPFEMFYQIKPPERTDKQTVQYPDLPLIYPDEEEYKMSHAEIKATLLKEFGGNSWGCNFEAPDERYLELDHINPKNGKRQPDLDHIFNRALLCPPCNREKGNSITLSELRRRNNVNGHPVQLSHAYEWTMQFFVNQVRQTSPRQPRLF